MSGGGIVDAAERVLGRLLDSTAFKDSVRLVVAHIDPESAPALARTAMLRDAELSLTVASALPALANVALRLAETALAEVEDKVSPEALRAFVRSLASELDLEAAARLHGRTARLRALLAPLGGELRAAFDERVRREASRD